VDAPVGRPLQRAEGRARRGATPIGEIDTQIAAHAVAEGLTLVTHNTRHFDQVPGLRIEDWVAEPPAPAKSMTKTRRQRS